MDGDVGGSSRFFFNEQSRDKRQSEWNIRHVNYLKKKKEYDSKVAKALKIFHDRIGPKAYDHVKRHLRVSPPQLRNAFNTLNKNLRLISWWCR